MLRLPQGIRDDRSSDQRPDRYVCTKCQKAAAFTVHLVEFRYGTVNEHFYILALASSPGVVPSGCPYGRLLSLDCHSDDNEDQ